MAVTNTVYTLKTYTVATDTDLVPASPNFTMATLLITNTTGTAITFKVTLTDGSNTSLAVLISTTSVAANEYTVLNVRSINVPATNYKIRVQASAAGMNFVASGVVIT